MNKQEFREFIEEQKTLGFLPLAKSVQELAPGTRYDLNLCNALKRTIPKKDLKTIQIKAQRANRLIFFRAAPENLAIIKEVCREKQICQKLWTSGELAKRLREKHNLLISPDTVNQWVREGKLESASNGRKHLFNPKSMKKIKRRILEIQKQRG